MGGSFMAASGALLEALCAPRSEQPLGAVAPLLWARCVERAQAEGGPSAGGRLCLTKADGTPLSRRVTMFGKLARAFKEAKPPNGVMLCHYSTSRLRERMTNESRTQFNKDIKELEVPLPPQLPPQLPPRPDPRDRRQ